MDVNAPEFTLEKQFSATTINDQETGTSNGSDHATPATTSTETHSPETPIVRGHSTPYTQFDTSGVDLANYRPDYSLLKCFLTDTGSNVSTPQAVSSLSFDSIEELLWQGNASGHVTSYYGNEMQKYTSFQVHAHNEIRSLLSTDFGVLSLTKNALRMSIRRGLTTYTHNSEHLKDMQCMTRVPSGLLVMGGHQENVIEFDIERCKNVRVTEIDQEGCVIIRTHPQYVCCGSTSGKITLRDQSQLRVTHTFNTHSGQLSDFDVHGNYLVTCGYGKRDNSYNVDRFLMVYDLRMNRAIAPIRMSFAPYLLRFVPLFSSKFAIVSQNGKFQLLDTSGSMSPPPYLHEVDLPVGGSVVSLDVSSSCQALAFGDDTGCIHLFGASEEVAFNNFSQPTEFADVVGVH